MKLIGGDGQTSQPPSNPPFLQMPLNSGILYNMRIRFRLVIFLLGASVCLPAHAQAGSLRVLTINVWSGLDYSGLLKMGEYESAGERDARFHSLVGYLKELVPDVIFIQEANPVVRYAVDLASALSMDEVHQVVNGGIRIGSMGIPVNLREGLAILARPGLELRKTGAWKLSGPPGMHSDLVSFHFGEVVLALAGNITWGGLDVYLVNVHLAAAPGIPEDVDGLRRSVLGKGGMDDAAFERALGRWRGREERRSSEIQKLLGRLDQLPGGTLQIVAGDFNAEPDSAQMKVFRNTGRFRDVLTWNEDDREHRDPMFTWNVERNPNTGFSVGDTDAGGKIRKGVDHLTALADHRSRRLDYIFLGKDFEGKVTIRARIVARGGAKNIPPSDHFGVFARIDQPEL